MTHLPACIRFMFAMLVAWNGTSIAFSKDESSSTPPNIVFVITDDQGYGDLSCHGNPVLKTPNIDHLASESIRLTDYHVAPTCSPTRASLLTGHWANRTGVWHTIAGRSLLKQSETTLAKILSSNGYATGIFGKWHLGDNAPFQPQDHGFQEVFIHGGGGVGQTPDFWNNAYLGGTYFHNGGPTKVNGWCTSVWFEQAKRFIQNQRLAKKPFFAYISTNAPHGPYHSNPDFREPYADQSKVTGSFFGMIAEIDHEVGNLRKWLANNGWSENTIFIFTTDNGTAGGAKVFNAGMRGKKGSPYEGGHRVPFFIHWPKANGNGGKNVSTLSHAVDIVPTLLDLCGVQTELPFDGRSLKPLLVDQDDSFDWNDRILITDSQRVLHPEKWRSSCVMRHDFRLVNQTELYQISKDPGQRKNVANQYPEEVARLQAFYDAWWDELAPGFSELPRIRLGDPTQKVAMLTAHDWAITGPTPWNQSLIRKGAMPDEPVFWNVDFSQAGRYRITLRRWPAEIDQPINAPVQAQASPTDTDAFRQSPGHPFRDLREASLKIGSIVRRKTFDDQATKVEFEVVVPAGPSELHANFSDEKELSLGAYYVTVQWLEPH